MANGRVITGFSMPYVALYEANEGVVTYSNGMPLARGVNVSIDPESSDDNIFYADNQQAETAAGTFTGGTATFTVDGLKNDAAKMILGLPNAVDGWVAYGDDQVIPYVGAGFIVRYQEDQVVTWVPMYLTKVTFGIPGTEAATQEDEIDWQTQELEATIMRDDTAKHNWKQVSETAYTTEAEAYAALKAALGGDAPVNP